MRASRAVTACLLAGRRAFVDLAVLWVLRALLRRLRRAAPALEQGANAKEGRPVAIETLPSPVPTPLMSPQAPPLTPMSLSLQAEGGIRRRRGSRTYSESDVSEQFRLDSEPAFQRQISPGFERQTSPGEFKRTTSPGLVRQMSDTVRENSIDKGMLTGGFGSGKESRSGDNKLVVAMVGLPARGKSYITKHIQRYLSFEGFGVRMFNAGDYRRRMLGAGQSAEFFDSGNEAARQVREQVAFSALEELLGWLAHTDGAHVGILDATNTTVERRAGLLERCSRVPGIRVAFLESICTDTEVLHKNYEMKLQNADYSLWDPELARQDFAHRVARYENEYETVEEDEDDGRVSFMKVLNCGQKTVQRNCHGFLLSKLAGYLLNMHIQDRVIYLTRHGQSEDNVCSKLGGDAKLTKDGMAFAGRLRRYFMERLGWGREDSLDCDGAGPKRGEGSEDKEGWVLMTSQLARTRMTARPLVEDERFVAQSGMRRVHTALLNEISAGVFDGYTLDSIKAKAPDEYAARNKDKLRYRYPKGESYLDVAARVRPLAMEIERERRPVLVIAHQAVLRTLLAFFQGASLEEVPTLEIPLHTVLELHISAHGCRVERVPLTGPEASQQPKRQDSFAVVAPSMQGA